MLKSNCFLPCVILVLSLGLRFGGVCTCPHEETTHHDSSPEHHCYCDLGTTALANAPILIHHLESKKIFSILIPQIIYKLDNVIYFSDKLIHASHAPPDKMPLYLQKQSFLI